MITKEDTSFLLNNSEIEIFKTDNKINSVGLKFGYSKHLSIIGLSRKKQIEVLNYLEKLSLKELEVLRK